MVDSSFDIVSKLDRQEVDNAVNQTAEGIASRYSFHRVDATIRLAGDAVEMEASSADHILAILDVLQSKLIRRGLSLRCLDYKNHESKSSDKIYKPVTPFRESIVQDITKKISKPIHEEDPRGAKTQIQGDELRVSSKSHDDLQTVIAPLKGPKSDELGVAPQFANHC